MKRAVLGLLMYTLILMLISGCSEQAVDGDILKGLEASLETQGISMQQEGRQSSDALEKVYPYKFTIQADPKSEDYILVYLFDGNNQVEQAIKNQHYTITSLTKFANITNANVLVVYFAPSGDLDKYQKKIEDAVNQL
ncbi:hypothetical protein [Paenibacillus antarcticus]|uniref:DUF4358 domain-containing protein n=2 Tax=Paenibacillus antarcticus TaxID=253703 RepID=A0A168QPA0_9BACL|nr:hypothetical protein [Paenibacillus antarcticus]OAB48023.1 hypothetical protein PBAT_03885 [Paenibacillus antarcticus]